MHTKLFYPGLSALAACLLLANPVSAATLQEAVQQTLNTSPDVLVDVNARRAREKELDQARAGYNFTIDLSAGVGHEISNNPSTRAGGDDKVHMARRETALDFRQMLFDGWATRSEVKRQSARVESSAHNVMNSSENSALRAIEAYLEVLRRRELLDLAQENLAVHEGIFDRINRRSRSGVGRRADLDQVQGRYSLSQSNLIASETNLRDAETSYLRVVGTAPDLDMQRPGDPAGLPGSMQEAVDQAVANHPIMGVADSDVEAAKAQHDAARHAFYPRVDFEMGSTLHNNLDGQLGRNQDAQAMLRMRYNLVNGGRDVARRGETAHLIDAAREVRNRAYREVVESVRLSWTAFQATNSQLDYLRQHQESSLQTREAYAKQFNIGRRTLLDLLDSENEYFQSKSSYIATGYDRLFSQYRILAGMGTLLNALDIAAPEETGLPPVHKRPAPIH